jgi:hypothetical protein
MYWIYDLPKWQLALLTVGFFVAVSLIAFALSRGWVHRRFSLSHETNEPVNGFFSGVGVFYGLLLGQVAVGAWQNADDVDNLVSREAAAAAAFYRDISGFPEPQKSRLQTQVRDYLHYVVDVAWPAHRNGDECFRGQALFMTRIDKVLLGFVPASEAEKTVYITAFEAFNKLVEAYRLRVDSVNSGLPMEMWVVVFFGGVLTIVVSFFFHISDRRAHVFLTGSLAVFIGLMIFLIASLDNPFRGPNGVDPDSYRRLLGILDVYDPALVD